MKKRNILMLCITAVWMLCTGVALASTKVGTPKVWTVPAVYTCDQEVTFYYDVTDVGFPEGVDLYLWAWQPTEPDAGNGDNSSDFAKLEYLGNNIYKKTMIPTEYFHSEVSAFESGDWPGFWQQLKTKRDDLWSTEFAAPDSRLEFQEFKSSGAPVRFFSGKKASGFSEAFTLDDPLTVLVNPDVYKFGDRTWAEVATDADFVTFGVHGGLNDWTIQQTLDVWRPACLAKTGFRRLNNGLWSWNVGIPAEYFAYNPDDAGNPVPTALADPDFKAAFNLENMTYLIVKVIKDAGGNNQWGVNSGDQKQKAGSSAPYPDPVFTMFPTRITAKDILTLTRQYNESTAGELTYTITAGRKILTGTMPGVRDRRSAIVNLTDELEGIDASELKLIIRNSKDAVVVETTIPLVTED